MFKIVDKDFINHLANVPHVIPLALLAHPEIKMVAPAANQDSINREVHVY